MFAFALGKQQSGRFTRGPSVESSISGTPRPADNLGYKPRRGFLDQLKSANNSGAPQKVSIKQKIVTSFRLDAARAKTRKWNLSEKNMVSQRSGNAAENSFSDTN